MSGPKGASAWPSEHLGVTSLHFWNKTQIVQGFRNVPTEGVERSNVLFRAGPRMAAQAETAPRPATTLSGEQVW